MTPRQHITKRKQQLKKLTEAHFGVDRGRQIYKRTFEHENILIEYLSQHYQLHRKRVLDIGSGYGNTLQFWGPKSAGVEIQPELVEWLKFCGLKTYQVNVDDNLAEIGKRYQAVFTDNLIEHLLSPHYYLMQIHHLLQPGGLLVIGHPIVPSSLVEWLWRKYLGHCGYEAVEHINFFTPETIKLTLERSGFEVVEQLVPGFKKLPNWLKLPPSLGPHLVSVARRRDDFTYPQKRYSLFDPGWAKILTGYHQ